MASDKLASVELTSLFPSVMSSVTTLLVFGTKQRAYL